jgi:hypothetical protein
MRGGRLPSRQWIYRNLSASNGENIPRVKRPFFTRFRGNPTSRAIFLRCDRVNARIRSFQRQVRCVNPVSGSMDKNSLCNLSAPVSSMRTQCSS